MMIELYNVVSVSQHKEDTLVTLHCLIHSSSNASEYIKRTNTIDGHSLNYKCKYVFLRQQFVSYITMHISSTYLCFAILFVVACTCTMNTFASLTCLQLRYVHVNIIRLRNGYFRGKPYLQLNKWKTAIDGLLRNSSQIPTLHYTLQ